MTFVLFLAEQSDCRFTFTRCLGSGNYASQGWASKMLVNMVVRSVKRSLQKLRSVNTANTAADQLQKLLRQTRHPGARLGSCWRWRRPRPR